MRRLAATLLLFLPLAFAAALPRPAAATAAPPPAGPFTTWTFQGICTDCTGVGTGTLVLSNYTPGTLLQTANFFSFDYSSNLLFFSANYLSIQFLGGVLTTAPGGDTVTLQLFPIPVNGGGPVPIFFFTEIDTAWCIGNSCAADFGPENSWSLAGVPVPEPATLALLGAGLLGLGAIRWRRA